MKETSQPRGSGVFRSPLLSPPGLVLRAAIIVIVFLICHVVGLRDYTIILSGTSPSETSRDVLRSALGCVYILFYFAFVVGVPILLIASGLLALLARLWPARPSERK